MTILRKKVFIPLLIILGILAASSGASYLVWQRAIYQKGLAQIYLLRTYIQERAKKNRCGNISVMIKGLKSNFISPSIFSDNTSFEFNIDQPFAAASMIKLPMAACCFKAQREGRLDFTEKYQLKDTDRTEGSGVLKNMGSGKEFTIEDLLKLMIVESDNTAANIFIKRVGFDYFNGCFKELGLNSTQLNRYILDFSSRRKGIENYITARDVSVLLEKAASGKLVDQQASKEIMALLFRQRIKNRIPSLLPKDTPVANKTGTYNDVIHDAGVIYTPRGPLLLIILTQEVKDPIAAVNLIRRLSEFVYYIFVCGN
ncbi:MAG: serine hydrolase [Candidatus Omnitrophota bacterium]|jgi:beta-lactamase class A